jgi:PAS domain S-box-containing protein
MAVATSDTNERFADEHSALVRAKAPGRGGLHERPRLQIERLPLAYIVSDMEIRVLDWNPAAERIFGYSKEEILGRSTLDLIVPLRVSDQVLEIIQRIRAGDMEAHSINENRTKDGRIITCSWFNTPILDEQGAFAGVISLVQDITGEKQAEKKLREYYERVQALSHRLLAVQEEERRHLSIELHDEVGQMLTGLRFLLQPARQIESGTGNSRLDEARAMIDEILTKVRNLSFDLRPAALDHLGLVPAFLTLVERFTNQTGIRVDFKHTGVERRLPPEVETTAYRIVQEALTNVARHADVSEVAVRVWAAPDALCLQIEDRGRGFDAPVVMASRRTTGLAGMQERAKLVGGHLAVESTPGAGTRLTAKLPLNHRP